MNQGNSSLEVLAQQVPPQQPPVPAITHDELLPPVAVPAELPVQSPTQQDAARQPVPEVPLAVPVVDEKPSILTCLRDFAKQAGCERYAADGERIKLIIDYLWLRQLTPTLSFEMFLELYTPLADFDGENLKHPADALRAALPRSKKAAEASKAHQWAAKEVIGFVALYVDVIREAEGQCAPVPLGFSEFLMNGQMQEQYLAGAFEEEAAPKKSKDSNGKKKQAAVNVLDQPTAAGQRVVYSGPGGRQHRGVVTQLSLGADGGKAYVDFTTDAGEVMTGLGIQKFVVVDDPLPSPPQALDGEALPVLGSGIITIKRSQFPAVQQALAIKGQPMGNVAESDVIYPFAVQVAEDISAHVDVINGKEGPYVDPFIVRDGDMSHPVADLPPRDNIIGMYTFLTADGAYKVEVIANE